MGLLSWLATLHATMDRSLVCQSFHMWVTFPLVWDTLVPNPLAWVTNKMKGIFCLGKFWKPHKTRVQFRVGLQVADLNICRHVYFVQCMVIHYPLKLKYTWYKSISKFYGDILVPYLTWVNPNCTQAANLQFVRLQLGMLGFQLHLIQSTWCATLILPGSEIELWPRSSI